PTLVAFRGAGPRRSGRASRRSGRRGLPVRRRAGSAAQPLPRRHPDHPADGHHRQGADAARAGRARRSRVRQARSGGGTAMTGKQQRPGPNDLPAPPEQAHAPAADGAVEAGEDQWPHTEESSYHAAASRSALVGRGMTADELLLLPAAFPFDPVVPAAFGISRSAAYRALAVG